jgi:hypothetical protein
VPASSDRGGGGEEEIRMEKWIEDANRTGIEAKPAPLAGFVRE